MSADYAELHAPIVPALRELLRWAGLPRGGLVLDLAGGAGDKLALLRDALGAATRVLNADLDAAAVARSAADLRLVADAHALPLRDGCLDAAVCIAAWGALHTPEIALRELRRALRPGAPALLVTATTRWAALKLPTGTQLEAYKRAIQANAAPRAASTDLDVGLVAGAQAAGGVGIGLRAFAYEADPDPLAAELALQTDDPADVAQTAILLAVRWRRPSS